MIVDGDTDWDGVYMIVGGFGDDAVNNDFVPIPEEGLAMLSMPQSCIALRQTSLVG